MTQTLIEKLEALPNWYDNGGNLVVDANELLKIIEQAKAEQAEPFGYFKAEPFGWTDCSEHDEGAIALYEKPQPTPQDEKDKQIERLKAAFHLNMVKAYPEKSHAEITAAIEQAMKGA